MVNPNPLMADRVDNSMGMIGDEQNQPSWTTIGEMTSTSDSPDTSDIKAFIKKKGFDPANFHIKLVPKGKKNIIQKIFDVAIMPKTLGVSDAIIPKGASPLNARMDAPLGATLNTNINAPLLGGTRLNTRMDAPLGDSFGAPPLSEMSQGRRPHSIHHETVPNPDKYYNEEDVFGVAGGSGSYGTPAGSLISGTDKEGVIPIQGYDGPTLRAEKFPYSSGMGATVGEKQFAKDQKKKNDATKSKRWTTDGVILGYTLSEATDNFNKEKAKLKAKFPNMTFKIKEGGKAIQVALIQKRTLGFIWNTVKSFAPVDNARANAAIIELKQANPKAEFRMKVDNKTPFFLFQKAN